MQLLVVRACASPEGHWGQCRKRDTCGDSGHVCSRPVRGMVRAVSERVWEERVCIIKTKFF